MAKPGVNGRVIGPGPSSGTPAPAPAICGGALADVRLRLAAPELPADYDGYLPERVEVNLRPALRRKFRAIYDALVAGRVSISAPAGSDPPDKPVHKFPHVFVWLLEHVKLEPAQDAGK